MQGLAVQSRQHWPIHLEDGCVDSLVIAFSPLPGPASVPYRKARSAHFLSRGANAGVQYARAGRCGHVQICKVDRNGGFQRWRSGALIREYLTGSGNHHSDDGQTSRRFHIQDFHGRFLWCCSAAEHSGPRYARTIARTHVRTLWPQAESF
jgi:hypothetical protein